jgi:hypothetical protein
VNNPYLSKDFINATKDYFYFVEKDYPQKATIKLIGDRYRLNGLERSVLLRGIIKKNIANERKKKILKESEIIDQMLLIDCYNVLITISSYLNGNFFYISNDGFLRDSTESHGKIKNNEMISRSLNLMFKYFIEKKIKRVEIYLDSPVSYSKELSKKIYQLFKEYKIIGECFLVKSADYHLIHNNNGICSTSDSIIIDKKNNIFDLAFYILKHFFKPDFFYLDSFIK